MRNVVKNEKLFVVIFLVVCLFFEMVVNNFVIASSSYIFVSGATSVEQGNRIVFSVNFSNSVKNIWLSDGDIIKNGFSGTTKVSKNSERSYTVTISNITGLGNGKTITINGGVGSVNGVQTQAVSSNPFTITKKVVQPPVIIPDDNHQNTDNNQGNNSGNQNQDSNRPDNSGNNDQNNPQPSPSNPGNNDQNNSSQNTSSKPSTGNQTSSQNPVNDNTSRPTNNQVILNAGIPNDENKEKEESKEDKQEVKEETIKRPIPNTGKI